MQKQAPSVFQLATIAGFALSCFGILLFLWIAFGGPTPLKAQGYFVKVPFLEAQTLSAQSDVRISGVSVGKVTTVELGDNGRAIATIELEAPYAPVPSGTRAILRQKTLLGETYVELTPAGSEERPIQDGGELPVAQVSEAVQLDEIFRTFDPETRAAFQTWQRDVAIALDGRAVDLSNAFALLEPTFSTANRVLRTLDTQQAAVSRLVKNTGVVFNALTERQGQLRGLIENSNAVFQTTAARNQDLQDLFVVLPTFLDESTATLNRLDTFANDTNPVITRLRPAIRDLAPVLIDTGRLAPSLERFFVGLRPVIRAAPRGFPSLRRVLDDDLPPLLARLQTFTQDLDPLLQNVGLYRREITAFLGNIAAATNALGIEPEIGGATLPYLRTGVPLGPDSLAAYPQRLSWNRNNPYIKPGGALELQRGRLLSFETRHCSTGPNAVFRDWAELTPAEQADFNESTSDLGQDLYDRLRRFAMVNERNTADVPAPPCVGQGPYQPLGQPGRPATKYQHVFRRR
jgi:phospholipid/cholesterol/gamma-HCH transport system substrate-binding protein